MLKGAKITFSISGNPYMDMFDGKYMVTFDVAMIKDRPDVAKGIAETLRGLADFIENYNNQKKDEI